MFADMFADMVSYETAMNMMRRSQGFHWGSVRLLGQGARFFGIRFRRCPPDVVHRTLPTGRCPPDAGHRFAICDAMIRKMKGVFLLRIRISSLYHGRKTEKNAAVFEKIRRRSFGRFSGELRSIYGSWAADPFWRGIFSLLCQGKSGVRRGLLNRKKRGRAEMEGDLAGSLGDSPEP